MEFQKIVNQYTRLCSSYQNCSQCPINNIRFDGDCLHTWYNEPQRFEEIVVQWAKDNPEPVYPTWEQWVATFPKAKLKDFCPIIFDSEYPCFTKCTECWRQRIPEYLAKQLGIEKNYAPSIIVDQETARTAHLDCNNTEVTK